MHEMARTKYVCVCVHALAKFICRFVDASVKRKENEAQGAYRNQ